MAAQIGQRPASQQIYRQTHSTVNPFHPEPMVR